MAGQDIRITPAGFISAKPPHLIGQRGASPFATATTVYDGFQNLLNLNDEVAWALLNGSTDEIARDSTATLFLGGNTKGSGDNVDVATQRLLVSIVDVPLETGVGNPSVQKLNANGEICTGGLPGGTPATNGTGYGAYGQLFTTAGTVTVVAASNIITGAGTAWNVDVLTANYAVVAANLSRNTIEPGDVIAVGAAGSRIYFRIIEVTDATHVKVFPTPTAGNPAIGGGKAYTIFRTGYGSWSRVEQIIIGSTDKLYGYYAGNSGLSLAGTVDHKPGTVEAVQIYDPHATGPAAEHFQAPKSVDTAGVTTGVDLNADDVIMYKGFLLYGAGSAISWSVANFPTAVPFGATDFPARNIEVINRKNRFVCFEVLGDQVVAIFEDSLWLCVATGAVPEFNFYRLPEPLAVEHAARAEPCGITGGYVFGRPTCSGRSSIFYMSNRGVEQCSGGPSEEVSRPISDAITTVLGTTPYFLAWDNAFDTVWVRQAFGQNTFSPAGGQNVCLVYSVANGQWSTAKVQQVTGTTLVGVTAGVSPKTQLNDEVRLLHLGYYEVLTPAGTPGTDGGDIRHLTTGLDRPVQTPGLVPWIWNTPVIPMGLDYPDMQFGGFMLDSFAVNASGGAAPTDISWSIYGGSSPYSLTLREGPTALPQSGVVRPSSWTSSLDMKGSKWDDTFTLIRFTGLSWIQIAGLIIFKSETQAKR